MATNDKYVSDVPLKDKPIKRIGLRIKEGSITNPKIADGAVTAEKIADNAIEGRHITDNSIESRHILDNSIPGEKIKDGTIENVDIKDGTLSGEKLKDNTLEGSKLKDDIIESRHLKDNSIGAEKIKDGTIESVDIKDGTLSGEKIKDNTVQGIKLADGAVGEDKLVDNSITTAKIAPNAVTEDKIVDKSVTNAKIAAGAVTTAKIGDGEVHEKHLAPGAVTTAKFADGTIEQLQTIMDEVPTAGSVKPINSAGVLAHGSAFDVSEYNKSEGVLATYETLAAALDAVPATSQRGGMSVKFIQLTPATYSIVKTEGIETQPTGTEVQEALSVGTGSYTAEQLSGITLPSAVGGSVTYWMAVTADEVTTFTTWVITYASVESQEYVQYRLMSNDWSDDDADWQGVDEEPMPGSRNLVESGSLANIYNSFDNIVAYDWAKEMSWELIYNENQGFSGVVYENGIVTYNHPGTANDRSIVSIGVIPAGKTIVFTVGSISGFQDNRLFIRKNATSSSEGDAVLTVNPNSTAELVSTGIEYYIYVRGKYNSRQGIINGITIKEKGAKEGTVIKKAALEDDIVYAGENFVSLEEKVNEQDDTVSVIHKDDVASTVLSSKGSYQFDILYKAYNTAQNYPLKLKRNKRYTFLCTIPSQIVTTAPVYANILKSSDNTGVFNLQIDTGNTESQDIRIPYEEDCYLTIKTASRNLVGQRITVIANEIEDEVDVKANMGINPFRDKMFYDHLFQDQGSNFVIPQESIFSLDIAHRLGFKVTELNTALSSDGVAFVFHPDGNNFGATFKHVDGVTVVRNVAVNSMTAAEIKANIRYNSSVEKYQTAPSTLEEFLKACRGYNMIPLLQHQSVASTLDLADKIMGVGNYIAYGTPRRYTGAIVTTFHSLTTKDAIVTKCQQYNTPYMYCMGNPNSFTDDELSDIVGTLHQMGYMISSAYVPNEQTNQRLKRLGFDSIAASYQINSFDGANIACVGLSEIDTTGVLSDGKIILSNGETAGYTHSDSVFLAAASVSIRFNGTITLSLGATGSQTLTSDGSNYMEITSYVFNQAPKLLITSSGSSVILDFVLKIDER